MRPGGGVDRCHHCGGRNGGPSKNSKQKCDPGIPLLGILPKISETTNLKRYMGPCVLGALGTIAEVWKQPECPSVDGWIR